MSKAIIDWDSFLEILGRELINAPNRTITTLAVGVSLTGFVWSVWIETTMSVPKGLVVYSIVAVLQFIVMRYGVAMVRRPTRQ